MRKIVWLVLGNEQMSNGWPFSHQMIPFFVVVLVLLRAI